MEGVELIQINDQNIVSVSATIHYNTLYTLLSGYNNERHLLPLYNRYI